ncbi:hypothetical protein [Pseudomonas yamanorum]|uniref:hypothetical protein n=1 Tax=Pseudomonas yamanorum TaxID=515393 RepID=UPI00087CE067|nr:hypothetical protein [Pseudomonas yamanorum]SDT97879.1 hypothetical protein SAMN05216237_1007 [Pseudomonas yamanorum]
MSDNKNLKALCEAAPTGPWLVENDSLYFKDDGYTRHLLDADAGHDVEDEAYYAALKFIAAANPAVVLALIAENNALKGPHDWLAEDLIKELVDNAQALQENSDHGDSDPFAVVLLAAASRIRRQEANLDHLKTENKRLVPFEEAYATACNVRNRLIKENELLDRLIVTNKALSDSFRAERDQLKAENEALVSAMNDILRVTPMGVEAFGIAALVLGELSSAAMGQGEQS